MPKNKRNKTNKTQRKLGELNEKIFELGFAINLDLSDSDQFWRSLFRTLTLIADVKPNQLVDYSVFRVISELIPLLKKSNKELFDHFKKKELLIDLSYNLGTVEAIISGYLYSLLTTTEGVKKELGIIDRTLRENFKNYQTFATLLNSQDTQVPYFGNYISQLILQLKSLSKDLKHKDHKRKYLSIIGLIFEKNKYAIVSEEAIEKFIEKADSKADLELVPYLKEYLRIVAQEEKLPFSNELNSTQPTTEPKDEENQTASINSLFKELNPNSSYTYNPREPLEFWKQLFDEFILAIVKNINQKDLESKILIINKLLEESKNNTALEKILETNNGVGAIIDRYSDLSDFLEGKSKNPIYSTVFRLLPTNEKLKKKRFENKETFKYFQLALAYEPDSKKKKQELLVYLELSGKNPNDLEAILVHATFKELVGQKILAEHLKEHLYLVTSLQLEEIQRSVLAFDLDEAQKNLNKEGFLEILDHLVKSETSDQLSEFLEQSLNSNLLPLVAFSLIPGWKELVEKAIGKSEQLKLISELVDSKSYINDSEYKVLAFLNTEEFVEHLSKKSRDIIIETIENLIDESQDGYISESPIDFLERVNFKLFSFSINFKNLEFCLQLFRGHQSENQEAALLAEEEKEAVAELSTKECVSNITSFYIKPKKKKKKKKKSFSEFIEPYVHRKDINEILQEVGKKLISHFIINSKKDFSVGFSVVKKFFEYLANTENTRKIPNYILDETLEKIRENSDENNLEYGLATLICYVQYKEYNISDELLKKLDFYNERITDHTLKKFFQEEIIDRFFIKRMEMAIENADCTQKKGQLNDEGRLTKIFGTAPKLAKSIV